MPSGVYYRTAATREILRQAHLGKKRNPYPYPKVFDLCWCGCGETVWNGNRYIQGHKFHDEVTKEKIGMTKLGKERDEATKQKISMALQGENSPNWNGGISFGPYCYKFNRRLKEQIRNRDNRTCQECGKNERENKRKLDVHHVHYDKPNCNPDLISLCIICNFKANTNKDYWEEHFMRKLEERGLL